MKNCNITVLSEIMPSHLNLTLDFNFNFNLPHNQSINFMSINQNCMSFFFFRNSPHSAHLVRLIAERLVQLHMVQTGENHCKSNFPAKLQSYMEMIPTSFDDPKKQEM